MWQLIQIKPGYLIKGIYIMIKGLFLINVLLFSFTAVAADAVPYSIKAVNPIGVGFIELVGPGKMKVNNETVLYEGTTYISTKNIDSMTSSSGTSKGCVLHYSSENYVENISVETQSCNAIVSIFNIVNK